MQLYLLRHGIAEDNFEGPDADRPLSKEGRHKLKEAIPAIGKLTEGVELIFSSPLLRARQTAELVAESLPARHEVRSVPELQPQVRPSTLLTLLAKLPLSASVLLVGHEPLMGFLAAALLGAAEGSLEFKKGALCAIECEHEPGYGAGKLLWFATPRQLRTLSFE